MSNVEQGDMSLKEKSPDGFGELSGSEGKGSQKNPNRWESNVQSRPTTRAMASKERKVLSIKLMKGISAHYRTLDSGSKNVGEEDCKDAALENLDTRFAEVAEVYGQLNEICSGVIDGSILNAFTAYQSKIETEKRAIEEQLSELELSQELDAEYEEQMKILEELEERDRARGVKTDQLPAAAREPAPGEPIREHMEIKRATVTPNPNITQDSSLDLVQKLAESLATTLARTTPKKSVEPEPFDGDVATFVDWEVDMNAYLRAEAIEGPDRLRHLKRYVTGEAKRCIEGFFAVATDESYQQARAKLKQRYGNLQNVSRSFRQRLGAWPRINGRDGKGLRDFGDFLSHINSAMTSTPSLRSLNDSGENVKLLEKLPDWLRNQWARKVDRIEQKEDRYPSFTEFSEFIQDEARIMMLPASQPQPSYKPIRDKDNRTRNYQTEARSMRCLMCNQSHKLNGCPNLQALPYPERVSFVKEKKLCFGCLIGGHISRECRRRDTCGKCNKGHPTVLHNNRWVAEVNSRRETNGNSQPIRTNDGNPSTEPSNGTEVNVRSTTLNQETLSMTVPVYVSYDGGKEVLVHALLDTQSDACFIAKEVADNIKAHGKSKTITVCTLNGDSEKKTKWYKNIVIRGYLTDRKTVLNAYEQEYISCPTDQIPTAHKARQMSHLSKVAEQLPPNLDIPIGLLIGSNCPEALTPLCSIPGEPGQTFAIETMFGWTLCGGTSRMSDSQNAYRTETRDKEILQLLERDFNDNIGGKASQEDLKFLNILQTETKQNKDGNYELPLPFKTEVDLPDNKIQAVKRLNQLTNKLRNNIEYKTEYFRFMDNLIEKGHAEEVAPSMLTEPSSKWYIPHFGVTHPKKRKLRVVFDASAKFNGISLNDTLLQGPDHVNSLVGILLRFRKEKIAICCDIEKMFYNFYVPTYQRDHLRFLWLTEDLQQVKEYRMAVHLFGATSSPAVATFGLRKLARDYKDISPVAAAFLCDDFYVDDGITSVDSVEEASRLIKDSREICSKGNVRLHKFVSNSREVMSSVPTSERSESTKNIDLHSDKLPNERTLGMEWNVETDSFHFKLNITPKPTTKRGILSTVAQIYDPLGFVSPFILKGKRILQRVTASEVSWDTPLSAEQETEWAEWLKEMSKLDMFHVDRKVRSATEQLSTELHHFCDASLTGYGACSYLRQVGKDSTVHCTLLFAKARVNPLKPVTIPRLELQAAVTATRIRNLLLKELRMSIEKEYFWSDSKVVLGYIGNESKRFHMYVANRVHEIRQSSDACQWNYVKTKDNPADIVSRGASIEELMNSNWHAGPDFLKQADLKAYLQDNDVEKAINETDPEVRNTHVMATRVSLPNLAERFEKYSSWTSLVKSIAILRQLAKKQKWQRDPLTVQELHDAETFIIKSIQASHYAKDVKTLQSRDTVGKSSALSKLSPYLDGNGLLRVGGRLRRADLSQDERCPIIIPKHTHLARLLIRHFHQKICHLGQRSTLAAVREAGYWITSGTMMTKAVLNRCVTCARLRRPPESQEMGDLPTERLARTPPFTHVGMDVFGPYTVKDKRTVSKRYGLLFTCMYSRAVHIEMLEDLSTDAFINALRCFISLRGHVTTLHSDNGTNFVGARNQLHKEPSAVVNDNFKSYLLSNRIEFKMNTPDASHQGGSWERLIRSARAVLNGMSHKYKERLDTQTLRTAFYEVTSVLNSKPLTASNIGDPEEHVITPNQLLTMKLGHTPAPPPGRFNEEEIYGRIRWKKAQQLAEEFYKTWKSEYLSQITLRQKWTLKEKNIQAGDIVLLKDDNLPRNCWNLGVVEDTYKGEDNQVRNITLRLASSNLSSQGKPVSPATILRRPVQRVVLLLRANI